MKTFSKSLLAVTGLALSVACAPAFKGDGAKKPNAQKAFLKQMAAEHKLLEKLPQIKSIALSGAPENENSFPAKVELENLVLPNEGDKAVTTKVVETAVAADGESITIKPFDGTENTYSLELVCLENCAKVVGILTTTVKSAAPAKTEVKVEDKGEVKAEEKTEAKAEAKSEDKGDEETTISTQSDATAPDQLPQVVDDATIIKTGVVVNVAGEILHALKLKNVKATLEESVDELMADVGEAESRGLSTTIKKKK